MAGRALKRLMAEYKRKWMWPKKKWGLVSPLSYSMIRMCLSLCIVVANHKYRYLPSLLIVTQQSLHILLIADSFSELTLNPPEGIIAGPTNEENFFEWEALIM